MSRKRIWCLSMNTRRPSVKKFRRLCCRMEKDNGYKFFNGRDKQRHTPSYIGNSKMTKPLTRRQLAILDRHERRLLRTFMFIPKEGRFVYGIVGYGEDGGVDIFTPRDYFL